jgi:transcriptional regulator with XRE-family HTH domain
MISTDSPSMRDIFAKNLRVIRSNQGLSQEQLADEAGVHRTFVGAVERGETNISIDNIERLTRALKASPADLFAGWQA